MFIHAQPTIWSDLTLNFKSERRLENEKNIHPFVVLGLMGSCSTDLLPRNQETAEHY